MQYSKTMTASRIEATTANSAGPLPLQVKNVKGGMHRRTFVALGLGLAATSVLASTGAAQDGIGQARTSDAKSHEPIGRRKLGRLEVSAVG